jgi:hypothetical protein
MDDDQRNLVLEKRSDPDVRSRHILAAKGMSRSAANFRFGVMAGNDDAQIIVSFAADRLGAHAINDAQDDRTVSLHQCFSASA